MRKTDKKIENEIIRRLTDVCEDAKHECSGFSWLTHNVDYQRFPASLTVTLVFNETASEAMMLAALRHLVPEVQRALQPVLGLMLPASRIEARREYRTH